MNTLSKRLSLVAGLVLAASASQAQVSTNLLSQTTFDSSASVPWSYGYFYGNNGLGSFHDNHQYFAPDDVDMTNAMYQYTFDVTDLAGMTGWGTGTGAPLYRTETDPAAYVSGDRADYILSFDARVDGLDAGKTASNGEMQMQFYYPNPEGGNALMSLQVNLPFQPTSEWKTFTFPLDQGSLGANTVDADFAAHHGETSDIRFNVNFHEPFNAFGYDADNAFYLDNVKLQVVARPTTAPTPTYTVPILDWNMDDKGVWYEYNYDWSQNDNHLTRTASNNANNSNPNTLGVNGSSAWFLTVDNSSFVDNTPQWAGAGTGGGGPVDYAKFDTGDLSKYQVTFDARAAGLADGKTSTTVALQLAMESPDDTVQPADDNTGNDAIVQLNFAVKVTPDFQHYTFALNKGSVANGSVANFNTYYNTLNSIRTQWQIENAASLGDWNYDADNTLIVDNIKIERVIDGLAPLTYTATGNQLVLNWTAASTGTVKLQSAATVDGQFTDVTDVTGTTYTTQTTGAQRYFRLVWNQ